MAITVEERFRSRSGDASGRTRQYVVTDSTGDLTEQAGENAVGAFTVANSIEELDDFAITNIALTESLSNATRVDFAGGTEGTSTTFNLS